MTTDTEALRAAFEDYINPEGDVALHWQPAGYYAGGGLQGSWLDFQSGYWAGHAAAKAETAAAVAQPDYCPIGGESCQSNGTSRIEPLSDGRILGMWPDSGMPLKLIEFARCVEAAHGIGVKGRLSEWRCMKESKK